MKNDLLTIGPVTIHGYGLMIGIGVIAAYLTAEYRAKKLKLDPDQVFSLVIWCLIFGGLGSKLLFCLTTLDQILADPSFLLHSLANGWVVYGGLIGGVLGGFLFCRHKKINFLSYFDLALPSVALAQGFGRIGCFLAGCCYGLPTDSPIGITFTNSAYAPNGVSLIPTQLISSGLDFLHFFVLLFIAKRKKAEGQVGGFYLIFYSVGRFILEYFRGDMARGSVGELSTSQFIAVFTLLAGIGIVLGSRCLASRGVRAFLTGPDGTAFRPEAADDAGEESAAGGNTPDNGESVPDGKASDADASESAGSGASAEKEEENR